MPVDVSKSDGHSGDCFPQVFQALYGGQCLLSLGSADGGVQLGGLRDDQAMVGGQSPHVFAEPFGSRPPGHRSGGPARSATSSTTHGARGAQQR